MPIFSFEGGRGDDVILFDTADLVQGSIQGGTGNDLAIYTGGGESIILTLASHGLEALFAGAGDDHITGSDSDNIIAGGKGDDLLTGNGGDDMIVFGQKEHDDDWAHGARVSGIRRS